MNLGLTLKKGDTCDGWFAGFPDEHCEKPAVATTGYGKHCKAHYDRLLAVMD